MTTATEFFPPSWFANRERKRQAEEVVEALGHRLVDNRTPREIQTGTTVFQQPWSTRCENCQQPQRPLSNLARVPREVKITDPRWYVKERMEMLMESVVWCESCMYKFPVE